MEIVGHDNSDQTEIRAKLPKFGNVRCILNGNTRERMAEKETIIRTKIGNLMKVEGSISKSLTSIGQGLCDLLKLHPCPRYCGPFTGLINDQWEHAAFNLMIHSSDKDKKFQYFLTFTHSDAQKCGTWTFDKNETTSIDYPKFMVNAKQTKLYGPASTMSKTIVYPCEYGKCCIHCPCKLCTSHDRPCTIFCAKSPCKECDQQCKEHKIELDRTFSESDSFTIPFYYDTLDDEARTEEYPHSFIIYQLDWSCDPKSHLIKYAGIPRNCLTCHGDLLDHETHHSVLHYRCKFCRKYLRLLRGDPVNPINLLKEKKKMERDDSYTCAFCYKYFTQTSIRKYHERTEHNLVEKPFKCDKCPRSFASQIGLSHHQMTHSDTPKKYSCQTCNKTFTAESTLKRHIKSVHGNNIKLQCELCEKSFTRADNLTRHIHEAHLEPSVNIQYACQFAKPFKCDFCASSFKRKEKLNSHLWSSHAVETEIFQCEFCLKNFSTMKNKGRHINSIHK